MVAGDLRYLRQAFTCSDGPSVTWAEAERCLRRVLDRVECVGVTDHLDELLPQLAWHTGWVGVSAQVFRNGTAHFRHSNHIRLGRKSELRPAALAVLREEEARGVDIGAYRYAASLSNSRAMQARACLAKSRITLG